MFDYKTLAVRPLAGALGAEITDVDVSRALRPEVLAELQASLRDFGVIFLRDQKLTPEQHISFAEQWGPININRFFRSVEGYPQISEVSKAPTEKRNIGGNWHTDHSYDDIPALGSVLYAHEVPETGGDTLFANLALAYEALSPGMQAFLASLEAHHSSRHVFGAEANRDDDFKERLGNQEQATQDAVHPVVIRHPDTGRKTLYVNPGFTVKIQGWTVEESQPLLKYLYQHATKPEFTCRFQWRAGSLAIWDNRATWHYALNDYQGQRRYLHRITVEGVALH